MSTTITEAPVIAAPEPREKIPGLRKAAIFLVQVSSEHAGKIMAHMKESEVDEIAHEIMRLKDLGPHAVSDVLDEFHEMATARKFIGQGGFDFARNMLESGLGGEKANEILARLSMAFQETPFANLRNAEMRQVHSFLKDEHPQIIALVLAHLPAAMSADVLARMAPEAQPEIAHRLAVMDRAAPEVIRLVEEELARRMGSVAVRQDALTVGGVQSLVDIINRSDRSTERAIMEGLEATDPELAERVRAQMFVFEDIVKLDDRSVQQLLREVDAADLATALKGAKQDVVEKVTGNMSSGAATVLAEEIDLLGKVRLKQVEEAQAKVVSTIRSLEASGALVISRGSEDEFVD